MYVSHHVCMSLMYAGLRLSMADKNNSSKQRHTSFNIVQKIIPDPSAMIKKML